MDKLFLAMAGQEDPFVGSQFRYYRGSHSIDAYI